MSQLLTTQKFWPQLEMIWGLENFGLMQWWQCLIYNRRALNSFVWSRLYYRYLCFCFFKLCNRETPREKHLTLPVHIQDLSIYLFHVDNYFKVEIASSLDFLWKEQAQRENTEMEEMRRHTNQLLQGYDI